MYYMIDVDDLAIISLFTGVVLVEGEDIGRMQYILEKLEERPVYTHEMPDIADKHKDELAEMVRDIYKRAKEVDGFKKVMEDETNRVVNLWKNLLTDPPKPAKCPYNDLNNLTCDSCLMKDGECCNKYCKAKEKE